jgi:hypothetical protein
MPTGWLCWRRECCVRLFPIIVLNAVWLTRSPWSAIRDLRRSFRLISDDARVLAIVIAFCFGGLLEALAGFGAPVAITAVMLMGVGFTAMRSASVALLANTAAVAYGAIATPIITAGALTGISPTAIGSYVSRQTPIWLSSCRSCWRLSTGPRTAQALAVAGVVSISFGAAQFVSSNYVSVPAHRRRGRAGQPPRRGLLPSVASKRVGGRGVLIVSDHPPSAAASSAAASRRRPPRQQLHTHAAVSPGLRGRIQDSGQHRGAGLLSTDRGSGWPSSRT